MSHVSSPIPAVAHVRGCVPILGLFEELRLQNRHLQGSDYVVSTRSSLGMIVHHRGDLLDWLTRCFLGSSAVAVVIPERLSAQGWISQQSCLELKT